MKKTIFIAFGAAALLAVSAFPEAVAAGTQSAFRPKGRQHITYAPAPAAGQFLAFGPMDYGRTTKKPAMVTERFSVLDPATKYTLHVSNGGSSGQFEEKVTSAIIRLNGMIVVSPREYKRYVTDIVKPVTLRKNNRLDVELRGAPESGITIEIIGIDIVPPTITAVRDPSPNAAGWNNTNVTVSFVCSDMTSGIASCPGPVLLQDEAADQSVSGAAVDNAGNTASVTVTVSIDKTPPVVAIVSPPAGASLQDSPADVQGTVEELLSGIAGVTCNGIAADVLNTSFTCSVPLVTGDNMLEAAAVDVAGNTGSAGITVAYVPPELELAYVDDMQLIWKDAGSGGSFDGSYSRPVPPAGFFSLGSYGQSNYGPTNGFAYAAKALVDGALASPVDYTWVYSDWGSGADMDGSFWKPLPPPGYVCLGLVAQAGYTKPDTNAVKCVREDLTVPAKVGNTIWIDHGTGATYYFGSWQVVPADENGVFLGTFTGSGGTNDSAWSPPTGPLFTLDGRKVKRFDLGQAAIEEVIQMFGPNLYLYPPPPSPLIFGEHFFPDDPEYVLDHGMTLTWGLVENESNYSSFSFTPLGSHLTSASGLMQDVASYVQTSPFFGDPSFRHYLQIDEGQKPGNLSRAKAFVRVRPWNRLATELQFWFYYPYNGPARAEVCASGNWCDIQFFEQLGRHYGDWEQVTVRVDNRTKTLISVYMTRHSGGQWLPRGCFANNLGFDGTHPRIYSAVHSHAHYPTVGAHDYLRAWSKDYGVGTASVDLRDLASAGGEVLFSWLPGKYHVISSDLPAYDVAEPSWLQFTGRWGKYERLADDFYIPDTPIPVYTYTEMGAGPSGPSMKRSWTHGDSGENWWWTRYYEGKELCFDGIDNDDDGTVDCEDPDCAVPDPVCIYNSCLKAGSACVWRNAESCQ